MFFLCNSNWAIWVCFCVKTGDGLCKTYSRSLLQRLGVLEKDCKLARRRSVRYLPVLAAEGGIIDEITCS